MNLETDTSAQMMNDQHSVPKWSTAGGHLSPQSTANDRCQREIQRSYQNAEEFTWAVVYIYNFEIVLIILGALISMMRRTYNELRVELWNIPWMNFVCTSVLEVLYSINFPWTFVWRFSKVWTSSLRLYLGLEVLYSMDSWSW